MTTLAKKANVSREGNTRTSLSTPRRSVYWSFTHHTTDSGVSEIAFTNCLKGFCKKYFYGIEKCPSTGKIHLQGYFHAPNKDGKGFYFTQIKKKIPHTHLEASLGDEYQNKAYASKDGQIFEWEKPKEIKIPLYKQLQQDFSSLESIIAACYAREISTEFVTEEEWNRTSDNTYRQELNAWNHWHDREGWFIGNMPKEPEEPIPWRTAYYEVLLGRLEKHLYDIKLKKNISKYL